MINIHEAKTHLSRLVDTVAQGNEIVIAKAGVPMAKLVPLPKRKKPIQYGLLKGKVEIADDFDAPLSPEILKSFGVDA